MEVPRSNSVGLMAALFAVAAIGLVPVLAAAQAPILGMVSGAERARVEKLIRGAKKEGSVSVIDPIFSDRTERRLKAAFRKLYGLGPDFNVVITKKGTGRVVATVKQEIRAGKITYDVIIVGAPAFFVPAAKAGIFLEYDSPYWKHYVAGIKKANQLADPPRYVTPFGYAFQPLWNRKCPGMKGIEINSYQDLLNPKLRGKTIALDLPKSFTLTATWIAQGNVMDVVDFWTKFRDITDPIVMFRGDPRMQKVLSCERAVDPWNRSARAYQNKLKDPTLDIGVGVYKEGLLILGNQMGIPKGAPHPNAAKLFYDFVLRLEGITTIVEGEALYTFRANFKVPEVVEEYIPDAETTTFLPIDWEKTDRKALAKARNVWKKIFRAR